MQELAGRAAVVTGAASGIGLALCRALAAEGMSVVMADISPDRLHWAADSLSKESGTEVLPVVTDVSNQEAVVELERRARERFGKVHLLCNNAGVTLLGRAWRLEPEQLDWMLRINLFGVLHGIRAFVPGMMRLDQPAHVVNTASISGVLGMPRISGYATTKAAVVGLSESLLLDLRERNSQVGVSVLCPGAVATDLNEHSTVLRTGATDPTADADTGVDGPRASPDEIAAATIDAIRAGRFWILTHPGYNELLERRLQMMLGADLEPLAPGFFT